jgi:hypothetical protein
VALPASGALRVPARRPFTQRFTELAPYQKDIFYGTLICTAIATALLIAPSARPSHRVPRQGQAPRRVVANRFAIAGLASWRSR